MLGWIVYISKIEDGGDSPATGASEPGQLLACWKESVFGLEWLKTLVEARKALDLGGNGYPNRYTARADVLIPFILSEPPNERRRWEVAQGEKARDAFPGDTIVCPDAIRTCDSNVWLLVEAWDES